MTDPQLSPDEVASDTLKPDTLKSNTWESDTWESDTWEQIIISGAAKMGIPITGLQLKQLCRFAETLREWNRKINLTAIVDPEEIAVKHFLDSMAALPYIPEKGRMLDIGSGGGFPGLVLAVFRPFLKTTSLDSVRKKITFQQHLIRTVGLKEASAVHRRAEQLKSESMQRYDIIVSRALGSLGMFVNLALPLLAEHGVIIAYKGVMGDKEMDEIETLKSEDPGLLFDQCAYSLPKSGDRRALVFIRRSS